jgi:hypothetical protein
MENKKGISTIIVTVVLVALVLIAIGIVWAVVSGIFTRQQPIIDYTQKCIGVSIQPTAVDCTTPSACALTLTRSGTETEDIAGVKVIFRNDSGDSSLAAIDIDGNIGQLASVREIGINSGVSAPSSVEAVVYFIDLQRNEQLCQQKTSANI